MWEVPEDIGALQKEDETLKLLFAKAVGGPEMTTGGKDSFHVDGGMLYSLSDGAKRLVVPMRCRQMIPHLAHIALGGTSGSQQNISACCLQILLAVHVC